LPSLIDYHKKSNSLPHRIVFSLAALIVFYRGEYNGKPLPVKDGKDITDFFDASWSKFDNTDSSALQLSEDVLGNSSIWKTNLNDEIPGLASLVAKYMLDIQNLGMPAALTQLPRS
jgi:tagaturonate reductase